jgi:TM2 domain-containing membrane protein YozV
VPPVIALLLGFIPGVGAICNGQYAKGLIHAVIFGLLVSVEASTRHVPVNIICGIMIAAWVFYMAFEAFHTALRRRRGLPVEEFSSIFEVRPSHNRMPLGAIFLVVVGFLLLLQTTDIISMELLGRYWPVALIALGVYLLYARVHPGPGMNGSEHDVELHR